jgi:hypothetical protein
MSMRYKMPAGTGDCPPAAAARVLWLSLPEFYAKLPDLRARGFPAPDPTTGNYDMDAITAWRKQRHPQVYGEQLTPVTTARNANDVVRARLAGGRGG